MRSIEDKKLCYQDNNSTGLVFEFHRKGNNNINVVGAPNSTTRSSTTNSHGHRSTALGKLSAPSKWDDAQKWLVGLSRGGSGERTSGQNNKNKPRNSNADDLRLIAPVPHKDQEEEEEEEYYVSSSEEDKTSTEYQHHDVAEKTKNVDASAEAIWRINKPAAAAATVVRSVCVRDMGTEMTPIASQEPSRTATPVRARTPVARSPIASGCSTPIRALALDGPARGNNHNAAGSSTRRSCIDQENSTNSDHNHSNNSNSNDTSNVGNLNPLETRAVAWDEAERAKYMARYKREEVKIQAWENHEKRRAEMEMKKMEVKAERIKARAEEKMANKLAATRRIAEEKRANAEAKLNEKAVRTSERADYIRRTGHLPSSFSFKLPSLCW